MRSLPIIILVLAACSNDFAVRCAGDGDCVKFGAICSGGFCRLADLGVPDLAPVDLAPMSLEDLAPNFDLSTPVDFSPFCSSSGTCAPTTPICGTNGQCRACTVADAPQCLSRSRETPRCDGTTGTCTSCRASNAMDCPSAPYTVCGFDGSCRQACTQASDCASGVCDPGFVTPGASSCAWPDEVVYVKGASSCAGATGSQASPLCSLDAALAARPSGGFIRVLATATQLPYATTAITKPYVIVGDGPAAVTIRGAQAVVGHFTTYPAAFTVTDGGKLYLSGVGATVAGGIARCSASTANAATLSVSNVYGGGLNGIGVISNSCVATIDRVEIDTSLGGVSVTGGTLQQLSNVMATHNTGIGVYIGAGTSVPAVGLVYLTLAQNAATGADPGGVSCNVPVKVVNTISYFNTSVSGNADSAGSCTFSYSDVESPTVTGTSVVHISPSFAPGADPPQNTEWDYHLHGDTGMNDSCCVDKGVSITGVTHDIDGQSRPDGPAPDVGCDEI